MVPFFFLLEVHRPRLLKWSDIRFIDAKPAMSDNGAEVVHLSAPQQWHTTLDLTAGPVTFRNGGSPLATTTVVVAEGPREDNVPAPLSSLRGRRSYGRPTAEPTLAQPHHPGSGCEPPEKQAITASGWSSREPRSKAVDKIEEGARLPVEQGRGLG
ncbi:hypothetical protein ZIOFF_074390 (mitochondrion) [Zingiber officinale]|uniref:Uncharacterized protein n=1 Tax=Zingiber officinale TaxID=94328 RepID=A0A8J5ELM0_ZINOF|nr:hypothetical protein ZIOFF_074390 [Zingiber officinale]